MMSLIAIAAVDLAATFYLDIGTSFVMTWTGVILIMLAARNLNKS